MLTYDLKVGYGCNNRCKHCIIDDSKDRLVEKHENINLTTEECFKKINEATLKGVRNIVLTGGEVTIRKDFSRIIKKCNDAHMGITIQTNGRKLSSPEVINVVKNVDDIRFIVALHGEKPITHDNITQVQGSFNETCEGIKTMCDLNKLVILKVVISKINAKELCGILRIGAQLGVKYFCFAFPHGQGAARKNFEEVMPRYSFLKSILNELIMVAKESNVNIEFEAIPFCIIPENMNLVGELKYFDGNTICRQVKEELFDWTEVRKSIKTKDARCNECDMNEFCEGPWCEYVEAFGFDEFLPIVFPAKYRLRILDNIREFLNFNRK